MFDKTISLARRPIALALLGLAAVPLFGCNVLGVPILLFGKEPTKKVAAEYPYLDGKKVCILIWAEDDTQFRYPYVRLEVSEHVRIALNGTVRDITFIPNRQVVEFQDRNPSWAEQDPAQIGQRFGAERILLVELTQYTTREPGSRHLYRGHIGANVKVYDPAYSNSAPTYKTALETAYPPDSMGSYGTNDRSIRLAMMQAFAAELAGRFYERQEKVK